VSRRDLPRRAAAPLRLVLAHPFREGKLGIDQGHISVIGGLERRSQAAVSSADHDDRAVSLLLFSVLMPEDDRGADRCRPEIAGCVSFHLRSLDITQLPCTSSTWCPRETLAPFAIAGDNAITGATTEGGAEVGSVRFARPGSAGR